MAAGAVELQDVVKSLAGRRVVDGVSLRVEPGEFFALLGPSGCGKTTTLRMIAGFEEPDAGRVLLGGRDVAGVPPYRRDANLVFQSYALFPHLDVGSNVAFGLEVAGVGAQETAARVAEALALVRLEGVAARMPAQLSGGQQQRVAVARALVRRPSVLLLDEPLGALDLQLRKEMQIELKRLQRRLGTTFVYVTHDQDEAMTMADRVAVMERGRVAQSGTPEDVYARPASAFVARFLGDANLVPATVGAGCAEIDGGGAFDVADAGGRPAGSRATAVVRPERLTIAQSAVSGGRGGVEATVEEIAFTGADVRILTRTRGGALLVVRRPAAEGVRPRAGDAVRVVAPPDAVRLVDAEPAP